MIPERPLPVPYRLETARLVVRAWDPADASRLAEAVRESRDDLLTWLPWALEEPTSIDDKVELLRGFRARFDTGEEQFFGILDPDETRVVGGAGLHPRVGPGGTEMGYWIRSTETGRGLATETAAALARVALEALGLDRVEIRAEPANSASIAIPRRLGFEREALLRRRHAAGDGTWRDLEVFSLFAGSPAARALARRPLRAFDAAGREIAALASG